MCYTENSLSGVLGKSKSLSVKAIIAIWHKTKTQELQLLGFLVFKVKT